MLAKSKSLLVRISLCLLLAIAALIPVVQGNYSVSRSTDFPSTNGTVYDAVVDEDGILYIAGSFTSVGTYYGNAGIVDGTDGDPQTPFPKVNNGTVYVTLADGSGGWYVGGNFSNVDNETHESLIHVDSGGEITAFDADLNSGSTVFSLVLYGGNLYIGGNFTSVGGEAVSNLAVVNATTGAVDATWTPNPSGGSVLTMVADSDILYVGGVFTTIAGDGTKSKAAAFDISDTTPASDISLTTWDPNITAAGTVAVRALVTDATNVYIGGQFTSMDSNPRNRLGAWSKANALVAGFNPNISTGTTVNTLVRSGTTLYVGGTFTAVNGTTRNNLASVETDGSLNAWDPNVSSTVEDLAIIGTTIYAGGSFTTIDGGGTAQEYAAAFNNTDGTATAWDPDPDAPLNALATDGTDLYIGGTFTFLQPTVRNRVAAINTATNAITSFNPDLSDTVYSLAIDDTNNILFAGGDFTTVNTTVDSVTRNSLASFDTTSNTDNATSWNPNIGSSVYVVKLEDSTAYVGGSFTTVNGATARQGLASFDYTVDTTGNVSAWDPQLNGAFGGGGTARDIEIIDDTIYVGGAFLSVSSESTARSSLAAFNNTDGTATDWDPDVNDQFEGFAPNTVYALASDLSGTIYAGGNFTSVNVNQGGTNRNRIAAFDKTDGNVTDFDPDVNNTVYDLMIDGIGLYASGDFTTVNNGAANRGRSAVFDVTVDTGNVLTFTANVGNSVEAQLAHSSGIYIGGSFLASNSEYGNPKILQFDLSNSAPDTPTTLGPVGSVDGSSSTATQPSFTFTLADDDEVDAISYRIQIDNNVDFSTPVVDYTSGLNFPGEATFTVGQAAGSGAYAVGTADQELSAANYYWRVRAIDNHSSTSSYATANDGAIAFIVAAASSGGGGSSSSVPGVPTNVAATITDTNHVRLTWSDPASNASTIRIYRGKDPLPVDAGVAYATVTKGVEEYVDTNVSVGDKVSYILKGVSGGGDTGRASAKVTITVVAGATSEVSEPTEIADEETTEETDAENTGSQSTYEREKAKALEIGLITENPLKDANKCEALVVIARTAGWEIDQTVAEDGFSDTPLWCKPYAKAGRDKGVIEGRTPTILGMDSEMMRYEIAVMIARMLASSPEALTEAAKKDYYNDEIVDWAKGGVNWVYEAGIMTGYPDKTFKGAQAIIKIELAVALGRAFNLL